MAIIEKTVKAFVSGVHNLFPDELIPKDAASDAMSWFTKDGHSELAYGRQAIGGVGSIGKSYAEHLAYKANGTAVRYRKVDTKIQYLNGSTWTDVITGLTAAADYTCSNYQSLAGAFVYFFGIDGIFKVAVANPANYASLFVDGTNYKGFAFIDKGRTILWGRTKDPTGQYQSWIDNQRAVSGSTGVYTAVSGEATTSLGGTLAFKAGGATRSCFSVVITLTASGEIYTDDFNGNLTGSLGGTGTINYMTGAYVISAAGVGTAAYQWEDSNLRGITDFRYSATRLAGEGNIYRQDAGGDAIQLIIALDGSYFSMKKSSCYILTLNVSSDIADKNEIFRTNIGVSTLRSAVGTGAGIVYMNTASPSKPRIEILTRNPAGDNFQTVPLFPHFKFENYTLDDVMIGAWDAYVIVGCKEDSIENNRLLLCHVKNKTVDITYYGIRTNCQMNGILYGGDCVSQTTWELFTGFDDNGISITNFWDSAGDTFGDDVLKKEKKARYKGKIAPAQSIGVYLSLDDGDFALIGTILGSGDYVDYGVSFAVGTSFIGNSNIGGGSTTNVYNFLLEMKLHVSKFRKRKFRFIANGIGFASIEQMTDFDIWTYQQKLPSRYRIKQNVSLDGTQTDLANPPN